MSRAFLKVVLKAFIKPFEAPQRSVKIKIYLFSLRPGLGGKGFTFNSKKESVKNNLTL